MDDVEMFLFFHAKAFVYTKKKYTFQIHIIHEKKSQLGKKLANTFACSKEIFLSLIKY